MHGKYHECFSSSSPRNLVCFTEINTFSVQEFYLSYAILVCTVYRDSGGFVVRCTLAGRANNSVVYLTRNNSVY